jgi:hypothetical protein
MGWATDPRLAGAHNDTMSGEERSQGSSSPIRRKIESTDPRPAAGRAASASMGRGEGEEVKRRWIVAV